MNINIATYKDKVRGCWLGKSIGGTLGAPFEALRGVLELDFYTQDLSKGTPPNDDLDLQLIWLNAAERHGRAIDSALLGEYWISFICASWSEYGAGKNNMEIGIAPPLSGWYNNHNRNSCGAFIRSEIWACLNPGHPDRAVKYAYEDAIIDHSREGVFAEIFCAAIQSAAFAESDKFKLIDIGLSYIPADCDVAKAVHTALDAHKSGLDWKGARKKVLQATPGAFGMYRGYETQEPEPDIPVGPVGYDAPSNIGITMIGWLYGEDDIGKSVCIAAGCGEDADCTAATLGSIMGIIQGASGLPAKWADPISDEIKTWSLNTTEVRCGPTIPQTLTELFERTCKAMPLFMGADCDVINENGVELTLNSGDDLFCKPAPHGMFSSIDFVDRLQGDPFALVFKNFLIEVGVQFVDGIDLKPGEPLRLKFNITNKQSRQQWLNFRWFAPEDWEFSNGREFSLNLDQPHGGYGLSEFEMSLTAPMVDKPKFDIVLEISSTRRLSKLYIPMTLTNAVGTKR